MRRALPANYLAQRLASRPVRNFSILRISRSCSAILISRNRLTVATSRAKCICILVGNPRQFEPECRTPQQMRLAKSFCRYLEIAQTGYPIGYQPSPFHDNMYFIVRNSRPRGSANGPERHILKEPPREGVTAYLVRLVLNVLSTKPESDIANVSMGIR
jgi:hypothetical protein